MENNIIDIEGKKYDLTQVSSSTLELIQTTQFAQGEFQRKSTEAKVANVAFQSLLGSLRAALMSEQPYTPAAPQKETQMQPKAAPRAKTTRKKA